MVTQNTNSGKEPPVPEMLKPEDLALTLVVKRPLLNDLRSPEKSIKIENLFEEPTPSGKVRSTDGEEPSATPEAISYDNPALDVSVEFRAHDNIAAALQFITVPGESPEGAAAATKNKVVLKAAENEPGVPNGPDVPYEPGLLAASNGTLLKCRPETGMNSVVVFDGDPLVLRPLEGPARAALFGVLDGRFQWGELNLPAAEE